MFMTPQTTEPRPLKLRITDFEVLDRAGVFKDYMKAELIDGVIEVMNAEFRRHNFIKNELSYRLRRAFEALGSDFSAYNEASLALPSHSLPQADVVVAKGGHDDRYYEPADIAIVIEVADSTAKRDLTIKRALYAAGGIAEYWVIDVSRGLVHQFWKIENGIYDDTRSISLNGEIRSATIPELSIDGRGIL